MHGECSKSMAHSCLTKKLKVDIIVDVKKIIYLLKNVQINTSRYKNIYTSLFSYHRLQS